MTDNLHYNDMLSKNTAIFQAFWENEFDRMKEPVYAPLKKRYPSLKGIMEDFEDDYDPIARYESDRSIMGLFEGMAEIINSIKIIDKENRSQKISRMLDKVNPILDLYFRSAPVQEEFYNRIIEASKLIGKSYGVDPVELFKNQDSYDLVQGKAIPQRKIAEEFLEINQTSETSVFDAKRFYMNHAKTDGLTDKCILEEIKLIPTPKAVDALHLAVREYKAKEFDRIYR
ncbi:MAG: hypothetical protein U9R34_08130 [Nanoarchaeota archaeon]|nr:hypothetical protein [Nanoarchaeota archaeon]